jgi:predicted RNA binding protein YcfA (HicA-like mRNA interferase family)
VPVDRTATPREVVRTVPRAGQLGRGGGGPVPKVRDAVRMLEADGWVLARVRGSHRQFRHPEKAGTVTVAGAMSKDLAPGTWRSILRQSGGREV